MKRNITNVSGSVILLFLLALLQPLHANTKGDKPKGVDLKRENTLLQESLAVKEDELKELQDFTRSFELELGALLEQNHNLRIRYGIELSGRDKELAGERLRVELLNKHLGAIRKSVLLPGYGQYSRGDLGRGYFFGGVFLFSFLATSVSYLDMQNKQARVNRVPGFLFWVYEPRWSSYLAARQLTTGLLAVTTSVYLANLGDLIFRSPGGEELEREREKEAALLRPARPGNLASINGVGGEPLYAIKLEYQASVTW